MTEIAYETPRQEALREVSVYTVDEFVRAVRLGRPVFDCPPKTMLLMGRTGWLIYFIACRNRVKVGFSRNPYARMLDLVGHCPYQLSLIGVLDGGPQEEIRMHAVLQRRHVHCEWYQLDDELERIIYHHTFTYPVPRNNRAMRKPMQMVPSLSPSSGRVVTLKTG